MLPAALAFHRQSPDWSPTIASLTLAGEVQRIFRSGAPYKCFVVQEKSLLLKRDPRMSDESYETFPGNHHFE